MGYATIVHAHQVRDPSSCVWIDDDRREQPDKRGKNINKIYNIWQYCNVNVVLVTVSDRAEGKIQQRDYDASNEIFGSTRSYDSL